MIAASRRRSAARGQLVMMGRTGRRAQAATGSSRPGRSSCRRRPGLRHGREWGMVEAAVGASSGVTAGVVLAADLAVAGAVAGLVAAADLAGVGVVAEAEVAGVAAGEVAVVVGEAGAVVDAVEPSQGPSAPTLLYTMFHSIACTL